MGMLGRWAANERAGMMRTSVDACKEVQPCLEVTLPALLVGAEASAAGRNNPRVIYFWDAWHTSIPDRQ